MQVNVISSNHNYAAAHNAAKQAGAPGGFAAALASAVASNAQNSKGGADAPTAAANSTVGDSPVPIANPDLISQFGFRREPWGRNINDIRDITISTENLTDEQRRVLNERHDIDNIRPDSPEYDALMRDLVKMGVLSDIPYHWPSNIHAIFVCDDGYIIGFLRKVDDTPRNLMDWFGNSLDMWEQFRVILLAQESLNDGQRLLFKINESRRELFNALQDIFSERSDA